MNDQKTTARRVGFAPGGFQLYERGDGKQFWVAAQSYACWACAEADGYHQHFFYNVGACQFNNEAALVAFLDSYVEGEQ